jgi:serine/threonine protein kinase
VTLPLIGGGSALPCRGTAPKIRGCYSQAVCLFVLRRTSPVRPLSSFISSASKMSHSSTPFRSGEHVEISNRSLLPFRYVDKLGLGMSAVVDIVEHKETGQKFAHKVFRPYYGPEPEKLNQAFQNEINIIKQLHPHSHITQVHWSYACGNELGMLLTPVACDGDLRAYLRAIQDTAKPPTPDQQSILRRSFGCLASGLAHIHSHTIRHKDIKPQNILVHDGQMIYTDFGIAFDATLEDTTTTGKPEAFTRRYCAPEVANWEQRNRKSDVFSLGCVFIEIIAVLEPDIDLQISTSHPYWVMVDHIQKTLIQSSTSDSERDQLFRACHSMLQPRSSDRIGAEALLRHLLSIRSSHPDPVYELFCDDCTPGEKVAAARRLKVSCKDDKLVEGNALEESALKESALEEIEKPQFNRIFSPFHARIFKSISTQEAILKAVVMVLENMHLHEMHLYIILPLKKHGFIGIGCTKDVPQRLKEWKERCKHDIREYRQHASGQRLLVKHAQRVELLVHAELKDVRFKENRCEGCHMQHTEWFRTTPEHAAKVLKKFSDWTAKDPYQLDQTKTYWRLRNPITGGVHDIGMLCQPVAMEQ